MSGLLEVFTRAGQECVHMRAKDRDRVRDDRAVITADCEVSKDEQI